MGNQLNLREQNRNIRNAKKQFYQDIGLKVFLVGLNEPTAYSEITDLIVAKLEIFKMPPKLVLSISLKLVDKFNGEADKLAGFFETIELLKDYSEGVVEIDSNVRTWASPHINMSPIHTVSTHKHPAYVA